jgi:hypothetical protein
VEKREFAGAAAAAANQYATSTNWFAHEVDARYVRFTAQSWTGAVAQRAGVLTSTITGAGGAVCANPWVDPGATATDAVDDDSRLTSHIQVAGMPTQPGWECTPATHTITYSVEDVSGQTAQVTRQLTLTKTSHGPSVLLHGNELMTVQLNSEFVDPSAIATDLVDSCPPRGTPHLHVLRVGKVVGGANHDQPWDFTTKKLGTYSITYYATDADGNTTPEYERPSRTIIVVAPGRTIITVTGEDLVAVEYGGTYDAAVDAGATAKRGAVDKSAFVVTQGLPVSTNVLGTHEVKYTIDASAGTLAAIPASRFVVIEDTKAPAITLTSAAAGGSADGQRMTVEASRTEKFADPGWQVQDVGPDGDLSAAMVVAGSVDMRTPGQFTLHYSVQDRSGNMATATRVVTVVDSSKPVLTVTGAADVAYEAGGVYCPGDTTSVCPRGYTDAGASAADNVDLPSRLANHIQVSGAVDTKAVGTYKLTYNVKDTAGNVAVPKTRTVRVVDQTVPVITLLGEREVDVQHNKPFKDPGALCVDTLDSLPELGGPAACLVSGTVDTARVGSYVLAYLCADKAGNRAKSVTRTVNVVDDGAPVLTLVGEPLVRLEIGAQSYNDAGATATDASEADAVITKRIVVGGLPIDISKVRDNQVTYDVSDVSGNRATQLMRHVVVRDTVHPTIRTGHLRCTTGATRGCQTDYAAIGTYEGVRDGAFAASPRASEAAASSSRMGFGHGNRVARIERANLAPHIAAGSTVTAAQIVCTEEETDDYTGLAWVAGLTKGWLDGKPTASRQIDPSWAAIINGNLYGKKLDEHRKEEHMDSHVFDGTDLTALVQRWVDNPGSNFGYLVYPSASRASSTDTFSCTLAVDYLGPLVHEAATDFAGKALAGVEAIDLAPLRPAVTATETGVDTFDVGAYHLYYQATDDAGNIGHALRTVTVVDTTRPVLQLRAAQSIVLEAGRMFCPGTSYKLCVNASSEPHHWKAGCTATDTVDADDRLTSHIKPTGIELAALVSENLNPATTPRTFQITYTVDDEAGNAAAQVVQTITVKDSTAPIVRVRGSVHVDHEVGEAYVEGGASCMDGLDGVKDATASGAINVNKVGLYTTTYSCTDKAGNKAADAKRTVLIGDQTAPVLVVEGSDTVVVEAGAAYVDAGVTATDAGDPKIQEKVTVVVKQPSGVQKAFAQHAVQIDTAIVGDHLIMYDVKDPAGIDAQQVTRTVEVVDTTAPVITISGGDVTLEAGTTYVDQGATAYDLVTDPTDVTAEAHVHSDVPGSYVVTYHAEDEAGNHAETKKRAVVVSDTVKPVVALLGEATVVVEAGGEFCDEESDSICPRTFVDPGAAATDPNEVDAAEVLTKMIVVSGDLVQLQHLQVVGTFTLKYNLKDIAGNAAAEVVRTVVVRDTTPPKLFLLGPDEYRIEANSAGDGYIEYDVEAEDELDSLNGAEPEVKVDLGGLDTRKTGTYTITYSAADLAGNVAVPVTRVVIVEDTENPTIELLGEAVVELEAGIETYRAAAQAGDDGATNLVDAGATATDESHDDADLSADIVVSGLPVDTSAVGQTVVTYDVTDNAGMKAATVERVIIIRDTTAPTLKLNGAATTEIIAGPYAYSLCAIEPAGTGVMVARGGYTDANGEYFRGGKTTVGGLEYPTFVCPNCTDSTCTLEYRSTAKSWKIDCSGATRYTTNECGGGGGGTSPVAEGCEWAPHGHDGPVADLKMWPPACDPGCTATDAVTPTAALERAMQVVVHVDTKRPTVGGGNDPYLVSCHTADAAGNDAVFVTREVHVKDVDGPAVTPLGNGTVVVEGGRVYGDEGAVAIDYVDGVISERVVSSCDAGDQCSVDTSLVGSYTVTYSAADSAGNKGTAVRYVSVVDTTPPVLSYLPNQDFKEIEWEAGKPWPSDDIVYVDERLMWAIGKDAMTGVDNLTIVSDSDVNVLAVGAYNVSYLTTDAAGNQAEPLIRTVQVVDTTAPVLVLVGNSTVWHEAATAYVDEGLVANDTIATAAELQAGTKMTSDVDVMQVGEYEVTYVVSDTHGNQATVTRLVVVEDTTSPTISLRRYPGQPAGADPARVVLEASLDTYEDPGVLVTDTVEQPDPWCGKFPLPERADFNRSGEVLECEAAGLGALFPGELTSQGFRCAGADYQQYCVLPAYRCDTQVANCPDASDELLCLKEGTTCRMELEQEVLVSGLPVDTAVVGTATITYDVTDHSENAAFQATRVVSVVDTTPPDLRLFGDEWVHLDVCPFPLKPTRCEGYEEQVPLTPTADRVCTDTPCPTCCPSPRCTKDENEAIENAEAAWNPCRELGFRFEEEGFSAVDTVDGDITETVKRTLDGGAIDVREIQENKLLYQVTDEAGNTASVTRHVIISCPNGTFGVDHMGCKNCPIGSFCVLGQRALCPKSADGVLGQYQDNIHSTECKDCPRYTTVAFDGAALPSDCKCADGFLWDGANERCVDNVAPELTHCPGGAELSVGTNKGQRVADFDYDPGLMLCQLNISVSDNCMDFTPTGAVKERRRRRRDEDVCSPNATYATSCMEIGLSSLTGELDSPIYADADDQSNSEYADDLVDDDDELREVTGFQLALGAHTVVVTVGDGDLGEKDGKECKVDITVVDTEKPTTEGCPVGMATDGGENVVVISTAAGQDTATLALDMKLWDNDRAAVSGSDMRMCQFYDDAPNGAGWFCKCAAEPGSCSAAAECTLALGTHEYTYVVTDAAGNRADCNFTVEVVDSEAPEPLCGADIYAHALDNQVYASEICNGGFETWDATSGGCRDLNCGPTIPEGFPCIEPVQITWPELAHRDNHGLNSTVSSHNSSDAFPLGATTVTVAARDHAGNAASCGFTVVVCPARSFGVNCDKECKCPGENWLGTSRPLCHPRSGECFEEIAYSTAATCEMPDAASGMEAVYGEVELLGLQHWFFGYPSHVDEFATATRRLFQTFGGQSVEFAFFRPVEVRNADAAGASLYRHTIGMCVQAVRSDNATSVLHEKLQSTFGESCAGYVAGDFIRALDEGVVDKLFRGVEVVSVPEWELLQPATTQTTTTTTANFAANISAPADGGGDGDGDSPDDGGGVDPLYGYGDTRLSVQAAAGDTEIVVESENGFVAGDAVVVSPRTDAEEFHTLVGFGSLVLAEPLRFNQSVGARVQVWHSGLGPKNSLDGDDDGSSTATAADPKKSSGGVIAVVIILVLIVAAAAVFVYTSRKKAAEAEAKRLRQMARIQAGGTFEDEQQLYGEGAVEKDAQKGRRVEQATAGNFTINPSNYVSNPAYSKDGGGAAAGYQDVGSDPSARAGADNPQYATGGLSRGASVKRSVRKSKKGKSAAVVITDTSIGGGGAAGLGSVCEGAPQSSWSIPMAESEYNDLNGGDGEYLEVGSENQTTYVEAAASAAADGALAAASPFELSVGVLGREDAEKRLFDDADNAPKAGDFLVRESSSHPHHVLTVLIDPAERLYQHHVVQPSDEGPLTLNGNLLQQACNSMPELLKYLRSTADILPLTLSQPTAEEAYTMAAVNGSNDTYMDLLPSSFLVGQMGRSEAEEKLVEGEDPQAGRFLVRTSAAHPHHVLSVLIDPAAQSYQHHVLKTDGVDPALTMNGNQLSALCVTVPDVSLT